MTLPTTQELAHLYCVTVSDAGVITSPGKIEGEPADVLYWYDLMMYGEGDAVEEDEHDVYTLRFAVLDEDREKLGLDPDIVAADLYVDDNGFAHLTYRRTKYLFDEYGYFRGYIPAKAVEECSSPGSVDEPVAYWREKLGFYVPRNLAIRYLADFGAWERDELESKSDTDLAEIVLWVACGYIHEEREWLGLVD